MALYSPFLGLWAIFYFSANFFPFSAFGPARFPVCARRTDSQPWFLLGVQSWSRFVTRKSGHIWRIWAEMSQTLMPKSTKVAQIHLPERNSAKSRQILLNFTKFPPKFVNISAKIRQISQISFHKRALTLNTQVSTLSWKLAAPWKDST